MRKLKMLQVEDRTHKQVAKQAKQAGLSIKAYVQLMADACKSDVKAKQ